MRTLRTSALLALSLSFLICGTVSADLLVKLRFHMDSHKLFGISFPEIDTASQVWMSDTIARVDLSATSSLLFVKGSRLTTTLYHDRKTATIGDYFENDMIALQRAYDFDRDSNETSSLLVPYPAELQVTADSALINGYACRRYELAFQIDGGEYHVEIWAARETGVDEEFWFQFLHAISLVDPYFEEVMRLARQIEGIPIRMVKRFSLAGPEIECRDEVIAIEKAPADSSRYLIPSDYQIYQTHPLD